MALSYLPRAQLSTTKPGRLEAEKTHSTNQFVDGFLRFLVVRTCGIDFNEPRLGGGEVLHG